MSAPSTTRPSRPGTGAAPGALRLTLVHTRAQLLETLRVPVAVIGTIAFPALSLLFFVVPQPFARDAVAATAATSQIALFAVMSVCLFTYGVGVAEDRALPWDAYLRTLPVGPAPRLLGRLLNGLTFAVLGLLPVVAIGAALTAATLPVGRVALALGAILLAAMPMLGIGLTIGYALTTKAALAVAQVLLLPLAFGGGLFLPPETFPDWLETVSRLLPTRSGRDLLVAATTGADVSAAAPVVLAVWTVLAFGLAGWAYRRDEGRRFT